MERRRGRGGAATPALTGVDRVMLIEVADEGGAKAFAERYLRGKVTTSETDGVQISSDGRGDAAAIAGGFLILGPQAQVAASVALATGHGDSLGSDADYRRADRSSPGREPRQAWLSPELSRKVFGAGGSLAGFDTFVNAAGGKGVAASVSFADGAVELARAQPPGRRTLPRASRTSSRRCPAFEPTLAGNDRRRRARLPGAWRSRDERQGAAGPCRGDRPGALQGPEAASTATSITRTASISSRTCCPPSTASRR